MASVAAQDSLTIGVDVGGSFTDIVLSDGSQTWRAKSPTVPEAFAVGVLEGCRLVAARRNQTLAEMLPAVARFGLGTTAVTNALTVHKGERVGLLTTKGFEHVPLMARGERVARDGWLEMPWVPLSIGQIVGIDERIGRGGAVLKAISRDEIAVAIATLIETQQVSALAVSFLWSFLNPVHERIVLEVVRDRFPDLPVFAGSELQPVIREYERTMVAVMNAFCARSLAGIEDLDAELKSQGLQVPMLLLQANGGATTLAGARAAPVSLAASGPAAGVAAAAEVANVSGETNVVCGDMGGTSFDVGLVVEGKPIRRQRGEIHGVKLAQAHVEVMSVGSGGGSVGWIDSRGLLRVGPRSARAFPGPACYGRGGTEPTVTDAMLVLGFIDPGKFLGGTMRLDRDAAEAACERVGCELGLNALETAWGIRELALAEMVNAFRSHVSASGLDPRSLTGLTYGGSGSLFMVEICRRVGLQKLIAPELSSVLSAYGAASADVRVERIRAIGATAPFDAGGLTNAISELAHEAESLLAEKGVTKSDMTLNVEGDFRFERQSWEIPIGLTTNFNEAAAEVAFIERYKLQYGENSLAKGVPLELVSLRVVGLGLTTRASLPIITPSASREATSSGTRHVQTERRRAAVVAVYEATAIQPGDTIRGPLLVDAIDNTLWVPPGAQATMDERRSMIVEWNANG